MLLKGKPTLKPTENLSLKFYDFNNGTYQRTFILRKGEGGMLPDPESILQIKKGILHLTFQFTRDNTEYKFRYQENNFALIGAKTGGSDGSKTIKTVTSLIQRVKVFYYF